jgi:hypothetical protein
MARAATDGRRGAGSCLEPPPHPASPPPKGRRGDAPRRLNSPLRPVGAERPGEVGARGTIMPIRDRTRAKPIVTLERSEMPLNEPDRRGAAPVMTGNASQAVIHSRPRTCVSDRGGRICGS